MARFGWIALAAATVAVLLAAQQRPDYKVTITKEQGHIPVIAVPDFRASGDAAPLVATFNQTLWSDLQDSGLVKLAPKTLYPTVVPQQPSDMLDPPPPPSAQRKSKRSDAPAPPATGKAGGRFMSDWSNPPTEANFLAFGYAAAKQGLFVAFGYFYDLGQPTLKAAKVLGDLYTGPLTDDGARKAAHDFAADILKLFGGVPLAGTHIYFVSTRTGNKEIWGMDYDGSNQRRITHFNFIATSVAVSPDGSRLICMAYPGPEKNPRLFLYSVDPLRQLAFVNPPGTYAAQASFSSDGKQVLFTGSTGDSYRIYVANLDGSGARVIRSSPDVEVEPAMNPKNPNLIAFVSGRSGTPQIYTMDADGGSVTRVTNGIGEAYNPAWQPDGGHLAFAWTQGYEPGNLNIFIIDVANGTYVQMTHGGTKLERNEHPSWAPDGRHIVFDSNRSGTEQIYSMLADGSDLKQLTAEGNNTNPAWGK